MLLDLGPEKANLWMYWWCDLWAGTQPADHNPPFVCNLYWVWPRNDKSLAEAIMGQARPTCYCAAVCRRPKRISNHGHGGTQIHNLYGNIDNGRCGDCQSICICFIIFFYVFSWFPPNYLYKSNCKVKSTDTSILHTTEMNANRSMIFSCRFLEF